MKLKKKKTKHFGLPRWFRLLKGLFEFRLTELKYSVVLHGASEEVLEWHSLKLR